MNYIAIPGLKFAKRGQLPLGLSFVNSKTVISRICEHFDITFKELKGRSRLRSVAYARHTCMFLLSKNTSMTKTAIGILFDRDHTSVIHAINHIGDLMQTDDGIRLEVEQLKNTL